MATRPSSLAGTSFKDPPKAPIAVRAALTITALLIQPPFFSSPADDPHIVKRLTILGEAKEPDFAAPVCCVFHFYHPLTVYRGAYLARHSSHPL
jgi:hypothetical protein